MPVKTNFPYCYCKITTTVYENEGNRHKQMIQDGNYVPLSDSNVLFSVSEKQHMTGVISANERIINIITDAKHGEGDTPEYREQYLSLISKLNFKTHMNYSIKNYHSGPGRELELYGENETNNFIRKIFDSIGIPKQTINYILTKIDYPNEKISIVTEVCFS